MEKPFWTDTYLFFTLQKPGITFSIPHFDADGKLQSVLGVDIELATLCAFLKQLGIGVSGKALIIDRTGRVVAYPSDNWLPADKPDVEAPMLDELGDPVLIRAYNRLRIEGYGRKVLDFGDRRIIVSSEPVNMLTGRDWVVLIVVPESDFVGFVTDSGLAALIMSIIVVLIVAGLSGLLAWRNVAAERRISAAATLTERARDPHPDLRRTGACQRTGRWRRGGGPGKCDGNRRRGLFGQASGGVAAQSRPYGSPVRGLLRPGRPRSHDRNGIAPRPAPQPVRRAGQRRADRHRRCEQRPADVGAVRNLSGAARDQQRLYRADHLARPAAGNADGRGSAARRPRRRPGGICDALAVVLALRYAAVAAPAPVVSRAAATVAAGSGGAAPFESFAQRQSRLEQTLMRQNISLDDLSESAIDQAAIGVLKLPEWTTVAQRAPDSDEATVMDAIVDELRLVLEKSGVAYAALLGDQIVLAAFSRDKKAVAG